jgi:hypothetical protein
MSATDERIRDLTDGILELEMILEDDSWKEWFVGDPREHLQAMILERDELKQEREIHEKAPIADSDPKMKVIIAGSRYGISYETVARFIQLCPIHLSISEVVSGCANGVDSHGERWAQENQIPVKRFPADWHNNGKQAGFIRNLEMARYADGLIAIWDGQSKGTKHMIEIAKKKGLVVYVYQAP